MNARESDLTPGASHRRSTRPVLVGAAGLGILAGLLGPAFAALLGLALAVVLLLRAPALGLGLLVAARSSLDYFQELTVVPGLGLNPAATLGLGLLVLAGLVLLLGARARAGIDWGGAVGRLWALWLAACALAVIVGALRHGGEVAAGGVREIVRLGSLYGLYLAVVNLVPASANATRVLVWACFAGLVVPCLFATHQLVTGSALHNIHGVKRIIGTFGHPNPFGVYLASLTFLGVGFFLDLKGRRVARFVLALLIVMAGSLLLFTYSRSALGLLLGAFLLWAAWGSVRRRLVVFGGIGLAAVVLFPALAWRFQDLFVDDGQTQVGGEDATNSFAWRLINYQRLFGSFRESPLVGHGLSAIDAINPTRTRTAEGFDAGFAAHNEIVRVLVEQGVVGLVVWLVVAVGIWKALGSHTPARARSGTLPTFRPEVFPFAGDARGAGPVPSGHGAARNGPLAETAGAVRALFLALVLLSGVGMAFLNQTVLLYVIFTLLGAFHLASRAEMTGSGDRAPVPSEEEEDVAEG